MADTPRTLKKRVDDQNENLSLLGQGGIRINLQDMQLANQESAGNRRYHQGPVRFLRAWLLGAQPHPRCALPTSFI